MRPEWEQALKDNRGGIYGKNQKTKAKQAAKAAKWQEEQAALGSKIVKDGVEI